MVLYLKGSLLAYVRLGWKLSDSSKPSSLLLCENYLCKNINSTGFLPSVLRNFFVFVNDVPEK